MTTALLSLVMFVLGFVLGAVLCCVKIGSALCTQCIK